MKRSNSFTHNFVKLLAIKGLDEIFLSCYYWYTRYIELASCWDTRLPSDVRVRRPLISGSYTLILVIIELARINIRQSDIQHSASAEGRRRRWVSVAEIRKLKSHIHVFLVSWGLQRRLRSEIYRLHVIHP